MKRKHLLLSALVFPLLAMGKEYTITIKTNNGNPIGHTEVTISGSDTLLVTPATTVNSIMVSLKDAAGNVIEEHTAPAQAHSTLTLIAPELPSGYFLEVRDSRGVVYQEFRYQ